MNQRGFRILTLIIITGALLVLVGIGFYYLKIGSSVPRAPIETKKDRVVSRNQQNQDETRSTNIISIKTLNIGDRIGSFTVKSFSYYPGSQDYPIDTGEVFFEGEDIVSGQYSHHAMMGGICFKLDDASKGRIPRILEFGYEDEPAFFCSTSDSDAVAVSKLDATPKHPLDYGPYGEATVRIKNYHLVSLPKDVWDTAELVEVIDYQEY